MHPSQMNTPGPATNLPTSSLVLPQKEHRPSMRFGTERVYAAVQFFDAWLKIAKTSSATTVSRA
jgi:hypothetical protein